MAERSPGSWQCASRELQVARKEGQAGMKGAAQTGRGSLDTLTSKH